jgi:hypothetical protein
MKAIDNFSNDVWYKNQKFKEGRINLKDLIKEERSKHLICFLRINKAKKWWKGDDDE